MPREEIRGGEFCKKGAQHSVHPGKLRRGGPDGRLGLGAFFGLGSERWQFPVSSPFSPQPPVTRAVGRLNFCRIL